MAAAIEGRSTGPVMAVKVGKFSHARSCIQRTSVGIERQEGSESCSERTALSTEHRTNAQAKKAIRYWNT